MQTTLLGLAIAFIIALMAALIGPYYIDWNQFRPQFEAEATRVLGAPVRVGGALDARLLPTPSLRLRSVVVGGPNDLGKVRADKLDVEFSLGALMRGEWRANELSIEGMALDLGLDAKGRIDWPASSGTPSLGTLAIDRLNLTGRVALHDAASRSTLELTEIAFSGDVRSLAGSIRGDGNFMLSGTRYPFRVSSGQSADGRGTRLHLNIDPGVRAISADLDGVLSFEARAPRFEGAMVLAANAGPKTAGKGGEAPPPWRISARVRADPAAAKLEQLEASYGTEESALKFAGQADIRFGLAPLLHAVLSARQLDADKFVTSDDSAAEPIRLLPGLRAMIGRIPLPPIAAQIEFNSEQIMLGGRPLQNLAADLHSDARSWTVDLLDFRAPGATHIDFNGTNAQASPSGGFKGVLDVESTDPDVLAAWLQGRGEITYHSEKPLRLRGVVSVTANRLAIEALRAEIDGGAVEGRVALADRPAGGGSRLEAEFRAEHLDLDAACSFARALAGPQAEWPDEAQLSLDIGRATSAGQDLHPFKAKLGYGPKTISLDQLRVGEAGGVMVDGAGNFDRANATGKLALNSSAASLSQITGMIEPVAPALASRLNAMGIGQGQAALKLTLDVGKNAARADQASARAVLDFDAPQFKGVVKVTATPDAAALRGFDLETLRRSSVGIETRLSAERGRALVVLLGLDRAVAVGEGAAQFEGSITGAWRTPLQLQARMSGTGVDAEAQGTAEPWAAEPKASVDLKVRHVSLAPLFDLKPADGLVRDISLASRVSLLGNRLSFDDLDGATSGSRLRGHIALTLGQDSTIEGEVGMDGLDLAPAFALAIGAAGRDAAEPLGSGLLNGWRGHVAFQALHGSLPGGGELRPVSGTVKSDGQSLTFDAIKGRIGGGEATADIDARQGANGMTLNAHLQLTGVDGTALRYRALALLAGHVSMQMTLSSQGRSAQALTGALSGNGTVTLEGAEIAGLDARAFDAAIRASDRGLATDDTRLRQIVEAVLSSGALSVKSAQIPFTIRDGRLRISATSLDADGARAVVSGGFDFPADQADIRASLASTTAGTGTSRPEIQLFAAGPPDALNRIVDVTSLSTWLAVRTIDRETRRLDAIERGEPPPALPASVPPPAGAEPPAAAPSAIVPDQPFSEPRLPGPDPRRPPSKSKVFLPRPPLAPPGANAPVVSQQVAPLPPPIEVRPAPGVARPPKPKPPLVLMQPAITP
ncbi:AsmA family protein [Bradyrhizobium sp.]|uniref:AsmA family protein n=1 Tax=Bradyrhizobium sp. TaxID=376 RepID=UPI003C1F0F9F